MLIPVLAKTVCKLVKFLTKVEICGSINYLLSVISDQIQHDSCICAHEGHQPHIFKLHTYK